MYSTRGVDFHFYAEASLILLCVDEDVASSRDQARLSKRAVARQRSRAQDVVDGPCGVSVRQDGTGVGDREGERCDAVKSVALNRASEIAQRDGYRNRAGRRVNCSCLRELRWVFDDLTVLWGGGDAAVAWRYSTARSRRGSCACEEDRILAGCAVCSEIEDSVAFFTCVACGEELPSYEP